MDLSLDYVKMCEKANEIQKYEFDDGDFYCERELENTNYIFCIGVEYGGLNKGSDGVWWADTNGYSEGGIVSFKNLIWLPRQDQLQEMVEKDNWSISFNLDKGYWQMTWSKMMGTPELLLTKQTFIFYYKSLEQCWLGFVMKEKYNKTWNGEDWNEIH